MISRPLLLGATLLFALAGRASATPAHDPLLVEADLSAMAEPVRRGIAAYRELVETLSAEKEVESGRLAQAYGQLGQLYHAHTSTEAALAAYRNARRVDPRAHRWAYYVGALHHAGADLAAARTALEAALELAPEDLPTVLRLGEIALAQRRLADAEQLFRRVLALDPASAAGWFGLGQVAAERRDAGAAAVAFERVLYLQPEATLAHYPLALAYRDQGEVERAQEHLARRGETGVRSPDPLLRELTTLGKLSALQVVLAQAADRAIDARDLVGFATGQLHDVDGAPAYLEAALEEGREGEPLAAFERARVHHVIGALLVEQGRLDPAAEHFGAALAVAPELADAAVRLGNLHGRARRFAEAIARYDQALASEPANAEALLGRADALVLLGRDEEALEDLARAEALAPGQGRIVLRAAAALERLGRGAEALERYREAAALLGTDAQAASAHAGAGRVLEAQGDLDGAAAAFAAAARLDPTRPDHRLGVAAAAARRGRFAEAAESYRAVVDLDGANEQARVGEASALLLDGRWIEARARLEGAARVLPESATLRHLLARLLAACPDRPLRDGERAAALAEELWRKAPSPLVQETLAMALAEAGRFQRAAGLQAELLASPAPRSAEAAARLEANLTLYRRSEPCCATDERAVLLP